MTMPYTPRELTARMNRNPTGSGARTISIWPQGESHGAANGITAQVTSAGMNASAGASTNRGMFAAAGYVSSFTKFFTPSAMGCISP